MGSKNQIKEDEIYFASLRLCVRLLSKRPWLCSFVLFFVIVLFLWWFSLPKQLFSDPTSTVIESSDGSLLGAHIANDGQWRFPEIDEVPEKYKTCVLAFEDNYFFKHPGVNPISLGRAAIQNIRSGKIVSGGSTITMQLIRLSRKGKARNIQQKLIEILLAIRAEVCYSKNDILKKYVSHAPFGGNVVGLDAAAWRYYGKNPKNLSWAESATLAVLPNAPSLIYPGKQNDLLLQKRNRLLDRLAEQGKIDSTTCHLAKLEPLPKKVFAIPQMAPHLLNRVLIEHPGKRLKSTIDEQLQQHTNELINQHLIPLRANQIHNAAALVLNIEKGEVLAYVGNSPNPGIGQHGEQVDIISSPRSSGSILKPFLYAAMQDNGEILPNTLIPDIPTQIGGFSPQNFNLQFEGAVPASKALSKSLNIPAVRMLREFGVDRFYSLLKKLNFSTLSQPSNHYGLSLILGGSEVNLWDLAGAYSSMARILINYEENDGLTFSDDFRSPSYEKKQHSVEEFVNPPISAAAAWLTFDALLKVNRPDEETGWESFSSSKKVAWKTGTSFGFRDGWAVGLDRNYLVAVWCGNADGEGRPGLTGTSTAAPILFDIFNLLPATGWFTQPIDEMEQVPICLESGYRPNQYCTKTDSLWVIKKGLKTENCPYHHLVHLDPTGNYQVTSKCISVDQMQHQSWFTLPPVMEWYYKRKNPFYHALPPYMNGCSETDHGEIMELIYPRENDQIFVPIQLDGTTGQVVLEAAHNSSNATIFWHLDERYLGQTSGNHQLAIFPKIGDHVITLVDSEGNQLVKTIHCLSARKN
ncbi:penicillin-binding protein 1C [Sunxiuqinia sp. A32]|uniref:penicillin-binding protein 1C n=1 Tax=Sunxiuqinia sp. A32 TaxID=3461496 RepID=UPI004045DEF5